MLLMKLMMMTLMMYWVGEMLLRLVGLVPQGLVCVACQLQIHLPSQVDRQQQQQECCYYGQD